MASARSASTHVLIADAGILFGIGILLYQILHGASIEHVLLSTFVAGLAAYLTLALGVAVARRIIDSASDSTSEEHSSRPEAPDSTDDGAASSPEEPVESEEYNEQGAPEPQVA